MKSRNATGDTASVNKTPSFFPVRHPPGDNKYNDRIEVECGAILARYRITGCPQRPFPDKTLGILSDTTWLGVVLVRFCQ